MWADGYTNAINPGHWLAYNHSKSIYAFVQMNLYDMVSTNQWFEAYHMDSFSWKHTVKPLI